MMDKNKRYTVWNRISIFFVCAILFAGSAGCGRKNAAEEKTKSYTDRGSSEIDDIDNYLRSDTKDMKENKIKDTKESGQSATETPDEKTKRLRAEAISAPSVSADEVTDLHIEIHKKQHALQLWNEEKLIAEYPV